MTFLKITGACCAALLAGCNLNINIIGEGSVTSEDGAIQCSEPCSKRSIGSFKDVDLVATAAPGFEFHGFIGNTKFGSAEAVSETYDSPGGSFSYGYSLYAGWEGPAEWTSVRTNVTALFLPEGSTLQSVRSSGSICTLSTAYSAQCWGKSENSIDDRLNGSIHSLVVEVDNHYQRNHLCALSDSVIACWDEETTEPWIIPDYIEVPLSAAIYQSRLCVLHQAGGIPKVDCIRPDGSEISVPTLNNPSQIWATNEDGFCAQDIDDVQCWGAE